MEGRQKFLSLARRNIFILNDLRQCNIVPIALSIFQLATSKRNNIRLPNYQLQLTFISNICNDCLVINNN